MNKLHKHEVLRGSLKRQAARIAVDILVVEPAYEDTV